MATKKKSDSDSKVILTIPKINLETLKIQVVGLTPLLTNRFPPEVMMDIEKKQTRQASTRDARDPKAEFLRSRYMDPSGRKHMFPTSGFIQACVRAGKGCGIAMTDTRAGLRAADDFVEIKSAAPKMATHTVRLPNGSGSLAYRACYAKWSADLVVVFDRAFLSAEEVVNLFNRAGFGTGVGAWRPEKKGTYGTFEVKQKRVGTAAR